MMIILLCSRCHEFWSSPSPEFLVSPGIPWNNDFYDDDNNQALFKNQRSSNKSNGEEKAGDRSRQSVACSRQCGGLVSQEDLQGNKIIELVKKSQKADPAPRPAYSPTHDPESDLRKILRNSPEMLAKPTFSSDDDYGPFRFKQLLRPTVGPTESLRKRKVKGSGQSPWLSDSSQDSNSSKELFNKRRPQISMGVYYN